MLGNRLMVIFSVVPELSRQTCNQQSPLVLPSSSCGDSQKSCLSQSQLEQGSLGALAHDILPLKDVTAPVLKGQHQPLTADPALLRKERDSSREPPLLVMS